MDRTTIKQTIIFSSLLSLIMEHSKSSSPADAIVTRQSTFPDSNNSYVRNKIHSRVMRMSGRREKHNGRAGKAINRKGNLECELVGIHKVPISHLLLHFEAY